jgi:hypothetical protein
VSGEKRESDGRLTLLFFLTVFPPFCIAQSNTCAGRLGIDYPELVVFDLDACLWDQEMYEMTAMPDRTVTGPLNGA